MEALRPSREAAAEEWRRLVVAEREQVEALPDRPRPEDFYGPVAQRFVADPRRQDEPLLDALRGLVQPGETWIDVGAGGGRYALPIALLARQVYAVEPSRGMREALAAAAREYGIENVETYDERWPGESTAPVADVALICQVGYDIADFDAFLDEMDAHANRLCVAVMFTEAPITDWAGLWPAVHGEERHLLPAARELIALLFARGKAPEARFLDTTPRTYESLEALHAAARRPLWVLEGSELDERLRQAVEQTAIKTDEGFILRANQRKLGIITWEPKG